MMNSADDWAFFIVSRAHSDTMSTVLTHSKLKSKETGIYLVENTSLICFLPVKIFSFSTKYSLIKKKLT